MEWLRRHQKCTAKAMGPTLEAFPYADACNINFVPLLEGVLELQLLPSLEALH